MNKKHAYATYKRGKLYFDAVGWAMVKGVASRAKKSPKYIVTHAIMRCARLRNRNEKAKNA